MDVTFILVEPARAGNVGAAARALKTMGFSQLRIVGSEGITDDQTARAFAHGSTDILESAVYYRSLAAAVADRDMVVGTTGRRRGKREDYFTPREVCQMCLGEERGARIAVVFGREESGLSNEELDLCQIASAIPMRRPYPSLNLGQAVMVYAHELSPLVLDVAKKRYPDSSEQSVRVLIERLERVLPALGFDPGRSRYRRILERVGSAVQTDVNLMHSVVKAVELHADLPRGGRKMMGTTHRSTRLFVSGTAVREGDHLLSRLPQRTIGK